MEEWELFTRYVLQHYALHRALCALQLSPPIAYESDQNRDENPDLTD